MPRRMSRDHVVALSGGADSTAMSLRLVEAYGSEPFRFFCSPTGDELPDMVEHWERLECLLGKPIERVSNGTLASWTEHFGAIPNWRQRWCTRLLKIEPCLAYLKTKRAPVLYVGLRWDEPKRLGLYSEAVETVFPMRWWRWTRADVLDYLRRRGVKIPARTDCARCYGQRLSEWKSLWENHPDIYASAEADEEATMHTFRSPARDSWPASLRELRMQWEAGHWLRGEAARRQCSLFVLDAGPDERAQCRVCSL